ncbi:NADH-quinone oxidoreductase subunit C [Aneurinibacillus terranovensis]|uniref:NADH-quinone oxidoreductase subunit C n=1 Tax=Aneurinibacillus terranovensis TaxID=278991 RepID=UPI00042717F1
MSDETQKPTPEEKAAAAAKAKAAAAAKAKAAAAAAAKAKAAANAAANAGGETGGDDEKAKAAAAAKAKAAAAAAAKAKAAGAAEGEGAAAEPKKPSHNQPILDKFVKLITDAWGSDAIENSYINEASEHIPTLIVRKEKWHDIARMLHDDEQLAFDYLSLSLGVDYETHMESICYLYSYKHGHTVCVKVKIDRDAAVVSSVTDIWAGADWFERETYDLLGIKYEGHYNLQRILLPDSWVGHPLRKDYVQYDEEV